MKQNSATYALAAMAGLSLILSVGCKKVYDYVECHPEAEAKMCRIERFIHGSPFSSVDTIVFTYNQAGDPIKGRRPYASTGSPHYSFKYKNGRLTDFVGEYENGTSAEYWHKYFYDAAGRIVLDSQYTFVQIRNGQPCDAVIQQANHLTYDNKGRIIKVAAIFPDPQQNFIWDYTYNAAGNLVGGPGGESQFQYNDRASQLRTNKIWMFINRDYSLNGALGANVYNTYGLPTTLSVSGSIGRQFLGSYYFNAEISYNCSESAIPTM